MLSQSKGTHLTWVSISLHAGREEALQELEARTAELQQQVAAAQSAAAEAEARRDELAALQQGIQDNSAEMAVLQEQDAHLQR